MVLYSLFMFKIIIIQIKELEETCDVNLVHLQLPMIMMMVKGKAIPVTGHGGPLKNLNWYSGDGVQLGPLGTAATNRPIVPAPVDYDDGEIGGMIGRGNRSTQRKPAPVPLCPPQTPTCCPDANPGRRCGNPASNLLSYGTAYGGP
jgi:hypothetical protein